MKKRIVSLIVLSIFAIPVAQPFVGEYIGENISVASEIEEEEYTSIYNPKPPSKAEPNDIVKIPDDGLRLIIAYYLNLDEDKDITVENMRSLRNIYPYVTINNTYKRIRVTNLEGLQYADSLRVLNLELIRDFDEKEYNSEDYYEMYTIKESYKLDPEKTKFNVYTGILKPLKGLEKLETLSLEQSNITSKDLKDLNKTNVVDLTIKNSKITDISYLNNRSIKSLDLSGNFIRNVSDLDNFPELKDLNISDNVIKDIIFLKEKHSLKSLDISSNIPYSRLGDESIDLRPLSNLTSLNILRANSNGIKEIDSLSRMENLFILDLKYNKILDVSSLKEIYNVNSEFDIKDQKKEVILYEDSFRFSLPLMDIKGNQINLEDSYNIMHIEGSEYEFLEKDELYGRANWTNGPFSGEVIIINKKIVSEMLETTKNKPTYHNLRSTIDRLSYLNWYVEGEMNIWIKKIIDELENIEPIPQIVFSSLWPIDIPTDIKVGYTFRAYCESDGYYTNDDIEWSSSNEEILRVDALGNVEAVGVGNAKIIARVKGTDLESEVEISVIENEAENIQLGIFSPNIYKGEKVNIDAVVYPENAANKELEWKSSDEKVLKVDNEGNVEAVGVGEATITAKVKGTEVQSEIRIHVKENLVREIRMKKGFLNIKPGHKEKLEAYVWPEDAIDNELEWSSSNEKVVKVDEDGNLEAIGTGVASVGAAVKGRDYVWDSTHIVVSEINFDNSKVELYKGQKDELDPIVSPATTTEPKIEWSSSDENIVKVNSKGRIEAVSAGSAKVTAKIKDTDIMSEVEVVVKNVEAEIIVLDKYYFSLNQGEKSSINATVLPLNAEVKDIIWSSSNEKVAKVDEFGNVEALSEGSATLTAKVKGKDFVVSAKINVIRNEDVEREDTEETKEEIKEEIKEEAKEEVSATSVRLNSSNVELNKDESYKLIATINPRNSKEKEITWSSSDASVATVDSTGLVKAVGKGKATITAKVKGTQVSSNATVIVNEENEIKAESIKLNKSKVEITEGNEDDLVATVTPENSTQKEIEWSSSDSSVVTVDSNGRIKSIGSGTVTITAKIKGTDISTSAEVISIAKEIPVVSETVFTDIGEHWAKLSIMNAVDRGLFKGMSDTVFSPDLQITRGMFVTVLGRLAEETAEPNDKFADVNKEAYYAEYIAWAEENGIVKGYDNGNFEPDNNITREEMAAIIERYMAYKDIELKESDAEVFADADIISDWAKESVTKIQKAGIIEGKGEGVFDPQANSTRAEVATLLIRLIENYIE